MMSLGEKIGLGSFFQNKNGDLFSFAQLAPADRQALVVEFEDGPQTLRPCQSIARMFGGVVSWASSLLFRRKSPR